MACAQVHCTGLLASADPDGAGAADESKRVVSDNGCGTGDFERDCIPGKGTNRSVFIGDSKHDACGVRAITDKGKVIGDHRELLIDTLARHTLRDNLLPLYVALDAEVSPGINESADIYDERGETQMRKLNAIRIDFDDQFV